MPGGAEELTEIEERRNLPIKARRVALKACVAELEVAEQVVAVTDVVRLAKAQTVASLGSAIAALTVSR